MSTPTPTYSSEPQPDPQSQDAVANLGPYEDNLAYLEAEMEWIDVRCRRLLVERLIRGTRLAPEDEKYRRSDVDPEVLQERHRHLQGQEVSLRQEIDRRLAASEAAGRTPALVRMQDTWELDEFQRTVLLLLVGPSLQPGIEEHLRHLGEMACITVRSIYEFTQLCLRGRVYHRRDFLDGGTLGALGLILVTSPIDDPSLEDLLDSPIRLTARGLALMLGEASLEDGQESQPEPEEGSHEGQRLREDRRSGHSQDDHGDHRLHLMIPEIRLSDVVLPVPLMETVQEIVAAARHRGRLLDDWGIGQRDVYGQGLAVLLYGPPGTGKTHAAYAIAGELGLPLLLGSVPGLASKWVGETEQRLASMFSTAESEGAVLLLDEADSLLAARGEGIPSRHDDALVNALLQLIERHPGLILLSTNLRERLDGALSRRLAYQIHFPVPMAAERAALWQAMIPSTVPGAEGLNFIDLGKDYQLTGGTIRQAVRRAAFRAARQGTGISMSLLATAAAEEVAAQAGAGSRVRVMGFGR